jgi:hypothetical protein
MSIRNIKSSSNVGALTINGVPYTLARSDVFYYLKFIDYNKELFKAASNLTAKPTVIFYTENATNKVILDYSLANITDKTYLTAFFANLTQTSTFNLTNAGYLDKSELEANIGCTLTFSEYKENKVFATVTAVTDLNTALDVYFADYFTGSPQLSKAGSLGTNPTTLDYALVSVNPSTSRPLSSLGLIAGDVIEVVNSDSVNNQFKFKISETTTINQQEVLRLKPIFNDQVPTIESLLGTSSLVNLYVKGTSTQTPVLSGDLGCCSDGLNKIENNTNYQCHLRQGRFVIGFCVPGELVPPIPQQFLLDTNNIFLNLPANSGIFEGTISYGDQMRPILNLNLIVGNSELLQFFKIFLEKDKVYSFRQTDGSNLGFVIRLSTTPNTFNGFITSTYGTIRKNGVNSNLILQTYSDMPVLYVFLEQIVETSSGFTINYHSTDYVITLSN